MKRLFIYILFAALMLLRCSVDPGDNNRFRAYLASEHFGIHFYEEDFTIYEIHTFLEKKERLLEHINGSLNVDFDGFIQVYTTESRSYANNCPGELKIFESKSYLRNDEGHEIIHVVVFDELGYSRVSFLNEGLAESIQLELHHFNAIERFADYCRNRDSTCATSWPEESVSIRTQILQESIFLDYYEYQRAGAFIKYLSLEYGIEKVKDFYRKSVYRHGSDLVDEFENIFGITITEAEEDFWRRFNVCT